MERVGGEREREEGAALTGAGRPSRVRCKGQIGALGRGDLGTPMGPQMEDREGIVILEFGVRSWEGQC